MNNIVFNSQVQTQPHLGGNKSSLHLRPGKKVQSYNFFHDFKMIL